jgi:hypothetical protein
VKKLIYIAMALVMVLVLLSVWLAPHWHHLGIRDVTTFRVVLLVGVFQTVLAIYGGYLAVLALPPGMRTIPHQFSFIVLGIILFSLTFYVGLLNDRAQHEISTKLDTANAGLVNVYSLLPTLQQRQLNGVESLRSYIGGVLRSSSSQRSSTAPAEPQVPIPFIPPPPQSVVIKIKTPLSSSNNNELADAIDTFERRLRQKNSRVVANSDAITRVKSILNDPTRNNPNSLQDLTKEEQSARTFMESIVNSDVPQANAFLIELINRLGPQKESIELFSAIPTEPSINNFVIRASFLSALAYRLPK